MLLLAGLAAGTLLAPVPLPRLVAESDTVFAGTVLSTAAERGPAPERRITTAVTFGDLDVLKGAPGAKTIVLRFAGGRIGRHGLVVDGVPRFALGDRCVLFAAPGKDALCDTVGWAQGCFKVRVDPDTGRDVVADAEGRTVYGFAEGLPVLAPPAPGAAPLALGDFLALVRSALTREGR